MDVFSRCERRRFDAFLLVFYYRILSMFHLSVAMLIGSLAVSVTVISCIGYQASGRTTAAYLHPMG